MTDNRIRSPRLEVLLEQDDTDDLLAILIQTDNRDMVRFDRARAQRKWPKAGDAPLLWQTFLAWAALKRSGHDTGEFDQFEGRCVQISVVDADGNPVNPNDPQEDGTDPTQ